jgi:hypothetical protein
MSKPRVKAGQRGPTSQDGSGFVYYKEYWTGDSRDGALVNGDGWHYYRMNPAGFIFEAYEFYETEDGREIAAPLPEMQNVDWKEDLGFEDLEALDKTSEDEFLRVRSLTEKAEAR